MRGTIPGIAAAVTLMMVAPALASGAGAQGSDPVVRVSGTMRVDGNSTVRSWSCEAPVADILVTPGAGGLSVENLGGAVSGLEVLVFTPEMDCNNDTMNEHMWKALKSGDHPDIRFSMTRYRVTEGDAGRAVLIDGELELAGARQPLTISASVEARAEGGLVVKGSHEIVMTAFGIQPPRLMLGALRVHDPVQVIFDLVLEVGDAPSGATGN
jgi:hypothetical protein